MIFQTVSCREQYSFRLCQEPGGLLDIITHRSEAIVYRIFGDIEDDGSAPSAILIRAPNQGGMSNTIYIYLARQSLQDLLGLTDKEYGVWLMQGNAGLAQLLNDGHTPEYETVYLGWDELTAQLQEIVNTELGSTCCILQAIPGS